MVPYPPGPVGTPVGSAMSESRKRCLERAPVAPEGKTGAITDFLTTGPRTIATHAVARILVVEDEPAVAGALRARLLRSGYSVALAHGLTNALHSADGFDPALVVLDLRVAGDHGLARLRLVRPDAHLPVVLISASADELDRVHGLEAGADDFVPRPVSPREVAARVAAVLRRLAVTPATGMVMAALRAGPLVLDEQRRRSLLHGRTVTLTALESRLLAYLMRHPGEALGRQQLLEEVWGFTYGDLSTVTVHIRRLREKIEPDPALPRLIRTVWGTGYCFEPMGLD